MYAIKYRPSLNSRFSGKCHTYYILYVHGCVCVGDTYNFMDMSMNEEDSSSTTNLQDFFSQFGKNTSSTTEAGTCTGILYVYIHVN